MKGSNEIIWYQSFVPSGKSWGVLNFDKPLYLHNLRKFVSRGQKVKIMALFTDEIVSKCEDTKFDLIYLVRLNLGQENT